MNKPQRAHIWQTLRSLSPEELKFNIIEELPELYVSLSNNEHIKITKLLREYVYNHIIWSNDGLQIRKYCNGSISKLTAPQISYLFANKEIGVLCGGVATYLAKIYNLFGYESSTFNYGIPGVSTHVVTVVLVQENNVDKLIFQDATFNFTYLVNNRECSFFEIFKLLMESKAQDIIIEKGNISEKVIYFSNNNCGRENIRIYKESGILNEEPVLDKTMLSNKTIFRANGDLDFHSSYLRRHESEILNVLSEELDKSIDKCNVLELMLFPINMPLFQDKILQLQINELQKRLVNFHNICKRKYSKSRKDETFQLSWL